MVLPDRIELSTSPLPMECSTTELRQHARDLRESALKAPYQAAGSCHKGPSGASTRAGREGAKIAKMRRLLRTSSFNVAKPHGKAQRRCGSRSSVSHIPREIMILALPCGGLDHCVERRRNPICSDDGVADGRPAGLDQGKFDGRIMKGDQDGA